MFSEPNADKWGLVSMAIALISGEMCLERQKLKTLFLESELGECETFLVSPCPGAILEVAGSDVNLSVRRAVTGVAELFERFCETPTVPCVPPALQMRTRFDSPTARICRPRSTRRRRRRRRGQGPPAWRHPRRRETVRQSENRTRMKNKYDKG